MKSLALPSFTFVAVLLANLAAGSEAAASEL